MQHNLQQPLYNNVTQQQQQEQARNFQKQYYNYQEQKQVEEERYKPQTVRAASVAGYSPQQQQHHKVGGEPIQYKQAQFQRYVSQEQQQQHEYEQSCEQQEQYEPHQYGWKPIRRPVAKPQNQYHTQICSQTLPQVELHCVTSETATRTTISSSST